MNAAVSRPQDDPAGPDQPLLQVTDLRRSFSGVHALAGARLEVAGGSIVGLIGPNGAGKSTLCAVVAGSLAPTAGSVRLAGEEISGMPSYQVARRGLMRTFQLSSEFSRLTVMENLLVGAAPGRGESVCAALLGRRFWGGRERDLIGRAQELLERFDLIDKAHDYAGNLSGGQRRLVEIARALMGNPKLLILDEPLAGVTPRLIERIGRHLQQLRDDGVTLLLIEHELGFIGWVCDTVYVMAQGRVIAHGTVEEVRRLQVVTDAYLIG